MSLSKANGHLEVQYCPLMYKITAGTSQSCELAASPLICHAISPVMAVLGH
jgi:hypothetical protein